MGGLRRATWPTGGQPSGAETQSGPQPRALSASQMPSRWWAIAQLPPRLPRVSLAQHTQVKHLPCATPCQAVMGTRGESGLVSEKLVDLCQTG